MMLGDTWQRLRAPFALVVDMTAHTHMWECFDCNAAGCLLCGKLHFCAQGVCSDVAAVEDGSVCVITAFCVRTINFQESTYEDRVISCVPQQHLYSGDSVSNLTENVRFHAHELIASDRALQAYAEEQKRISSRVSQLTYKLMLAKKSRCILTVLQECMNRELCNCPPLPYNYEERCALVSKVVYYITHLMSQCRKRLHVRFKQSDLRVLTFGLIYMMRHGIHTQGVTMFPRLSAIRDILPSEPILQRVHKFRAKHITDVENKFKLLLRGMSCSDVKALGLHENA